MSTWADPQKGGRRPPAHRAMLYMSAPSTVSIPAGTTWRKLTMFDRAGMERGMVASTATDSIAIKRRGQFDAMPGDVVTVAAYHNQVSAVNLTYQNAALSIKSID